MNEEGCRGVVWLRAVVVVVASLGACEASQSDIAREEARAGAEAGPVMDVAQGVLSPCFSSAGAFPDCESVCGAQSASCSAAGCPVSGAGGLGSTVLFYANLDDCGANAPVLTQLTSCESTFATAAGLSPVPLTYVRCCCEGAPAEASAATPDPAELATLCAATCAAAEPDFSRSPECRDIAFCPERCEEALLGKRESCARCIAQGITWDAGSCGGSECRCAPPGFPGTDSPECAAACL